MSHDIVLYNHSIITVLYKRLHMNSYEHYNHKVIQSKYSIAYNIDILIYYI